MSGERHAVQVTIGGEEFTVRSSEAPEYTREVAQYLDAALARIRSSLPTVDAHKAAILAGLAIADELFQARHGDRELADQLRALQDEVARFLPPARRGGRGPSGQLTLGD